jgi:hypothetical protein
MCFMSCNIKVNKIDNKGLKDFIRLSKIEYDNTNPVTDYEQMVWKHLDTAHGPSTAINLNCKDETVGRVLLQPRKVRVGKKEVNIAFATDSLVHPEFRRPISNFFSIMKEIKNVHDFSLVLHTSNENTEALYHDVLKFRCPISLSSYGVPINLITTLKKVLGFDSVIFNFINNPYRLSLKLLYSLSNKFTNLTITNAAPEDSIFNEACINNTETEGFQILRDSFFLDWRFKKSPLWKANIFYVYSNGGYIGYFVIREVEIDNFMFTSIMDFSFNSKISWVELFHIRMYVINNAIINCSDAVFTLLNKEAKLTKRFIGFPLIIIPDKYLPHKTPFFAHINNGDVFSLDELRTLNISLADLDYF